MDSSELQRLCEASFVAGGIAVQTEGGRLRVAAACSDVGDLLVYFDEGEITVDVANITHRHFTPYPASPTYAACTVGDCLREAMEFAHGVLKDEWVLWRYKNGAGGSYRIDASNETQSDAPLDAEPVEQFVWSGPLR